MFTLWLAVACGLESAVDALPPPQEPADPGDGDPAGDPSGDGGGDGGAEGGDGEGEPTGVALAGPIADAPLGHLLARRDDPGEYIYEDEEHEQVELLSVGELEQGLLEAFETLLWVDPLLMHDAYEGSRQQGDGDCPFYYYTYDVNGYDYWYDTCTSTQGMSFAGWAYGYYLQPYWSGAYHYNNYAYFNGDARLIDPDGSAFEASGYANYYDYDYYDYRYTYQYAFGDFRWDGPGSAGTWLAAEISLAMTTYTFYNRANGGQYFYFDGGVSDPGPSLSSVHMDELFMSNASGGGDCELEPAGAVSARDHQGNWYDIEFHGSPYWGASVFPLECDGCGEAWYRGEYLGEVCPDFSPLTSWEELPW